MVQWILVQWYCVAGSNSVVAIKTKLSATVTDHDVRHLLWLRQQLGREVLHGREADVRFRVMNVEASLRGHRPSMGTIGRKMYAPIATRRVRERAPPTGIGKGTIA
jgi:hypothetical protein